jgi:phage N-6-adenine-methyltransferase
MSRDRKYESNAERQKASRRRQKRSVHFSSKSDNWRTPEWLFRALNEEFKFDVDVCASAKNAQLPVFYDKQTNGLKQKWTGSCWMNQPYGRRIGKWLQKAYVSARRNNAIVVCLIPARTDTRYWHRYCAKAEVRFLKGRLKFNNAGPAPFPSAVVVFKRNGSAVTIYVSCYGPGVIIVIIFAKAETWWLNYAVNKNRAGVNAGFSLPLYPPRDGEGIAGLQKSDYHSLI